MLQNNSLLACASWRGVLNSPRGVFLLLFIFLVFWESSAKGRSSLHYVKSIEPIHFVNSGVGSCDGIEVAQVAGLIARMRRQAKALGSFLKKNKIKWIGSVGGGVAGLL